MVKRRESNYSEDELGVIESRSVMASFPEGSVTIPGILVECCWGWL